MSGSVGRSYQGDIALDDISMTSGPCKVAASMYSYALKPSLKSPLYNVHLFTMAECYVLTMF